MQNTAKRKKVCICFCVFWDAREIPDPSNIKLAPTSLMTSVCFRNPAISGIKFKQKGSTEVPTIIRGGPDKNRALTSRYFGKKKHDESVAGGDIYEERKGLSGSKREKKVFLLVIMYGIVEVCAFELKKKIRRLKAILVWTVASKRVTFIANKWVYACSAPYFTLNL